MEVRCYISCLETCFYCCLYRNIVYRCLAQNARCYTMSHLTADDACFVHVSRETPDVTPCHTSPPQGVALAEVALPKGPSMSTRKETTTWI